MKKFAVLLLLCVMCQGLAPAGFAEVEEPLSEGAVKIDAENFPDTTFRDIVSGTCDINGDGILSPEEAKKITKLDLLLKGINDLTGINNFTELVYLDCTLNNLKYLNFSGCVNLVTIRCAGNQLVSLDVNYCTTLEYLDCSYNKLEHLDFSECVNLLGINIENNNLTSFNASNSALLQYINCSKNELVSLDVKNCKNLVELNCSGNKFKYLNLSGYSSLESLFCDKNELTFLDLSNCTSLDWLVCAENHLSSVNLNGCKSITIFDCSDNNFTSLDISIYQSLNSLYCGKNEITFINLSDCNALRMLSCEGNRLNSLDLTSCPGLHIIDCGNNNLRSLNFNKCPAISLIDCGNNEITSINLFGCKKIHTIRCSNNKLTTLDVGDSPSCRVTCDEGVSVIRVINKLSITTDTLPLATYKKSYNAKLKANGTAPITWKLISGTKLPAGLKLNKSSGKISGTTTKAGTFKFSIRATDARGHIDKKFKIIVGKKPSITTSKLPDGFSGVAVYSTNLSASGTLPIKWAKISGDFPSGFKLYESGYIFCPLLKEKGTFAFTIRAENAYGYQDKELTVTINNNPLISTSTLPNAINGVFYTADLEALGTKAIRWDIISGTLPDGLTLARTGYITGFPKTNGKFVFTVRASNKQGQDNKELSISVGTGPRISTNKALPNSITGVSYSAELKSEGTTPIIWSIYSGSLPKGLKLDGANGRISGTPTKAGTYTFRIRAKNDYGMALRAFTLTIGAKPAITTGATLKAGTKGTKYNVTLKASGTTPLKWSLKSGTLPNGLKLNKTTGKISGTPSKTGTFKFKIKAANSYGSATKNFTLKISSSSSASSVNSIEEIDDVEEFTPELQGTAAVSRIIILPEAAVSTEHHNAQNYEIVAVLPVISADKEGLYDFEVELDDDTPEGAELIYIANSDEPSDDDEIVEFYDEAGEEISYVPANHKISISIWLNKNVIYSPVIAVKKF